MELYFAIHCKGSLVLTVLFQTPAYIVTTPTLISIVFDPDHRVLFSAEQTGLHIKKKTNRTLPKCFHKGSPLITTTHLHVYVNPCVILINECSSLISFSVQADLCKFFFFYVKFDGAGRFLNYRACRIYFVHAFRMFLLFKTCFDISRTTSLCSLLPMPIWW